MDSKHITAAEAAEQLERGKAVIVTSRSGQQHEVIAVEGNWVQVLSDGDEQSEGITASEFNDLQGA